MNGEPRNDGQSTESPVTERGPGRSFTDPRRPLGEDMIERGDPVGADPEAGVYGRDHTVTTHGHGVAERAQCVAVLRQAEELMANGNPSARTDAGRRRAIEIAASRCGVKIADYDRSVKGDEELQSLQAAVMEAATVRCGAV